MKRLPMLALLAFVCLMLPLVIVRSVWAIFTNQRRAWNILVAFDRVGNAAANDDDKVTISSRAAYARDAGKPWGCVLCRLLDRIDPGHCDAAKDI